MLDGNRNGRSTCEERLHVKALKGTHECAAPNIPFGQDISGSQITWLAAEHTLGRATMISHSQPSTPPDVRKHSSVGAGCGAAEGSFNESIRVTATYASIDAQSIDAQSISDT